MPAAHIKSHTTPLRSQATGSISRQRIDAGPLPLAQKVNDGKSGDGTGNYLDQTAQTIRPNRHALAVQLVSVHFVFIHRCLSQLHRTEH
jgi:hypothetical protein